MEKLDFKELNRVYQRESGQDNQTDEISHHAMAALGVRSMDMDDVADTFCDAWPKAKKFFNWAFMIGAFVPGMAPLIVMAKGVMSAIDQVLVPVVCEGATPDSGGTTREPVDR